MLMQIAGAAASYGAYKMFGPQLQENARDTFNDLNAQFHSKLGSGVPPVMQVGYGNAESPMMQRRIAEEAQKRADNTMSNFQMVSNGAFWGATMGLSGEFSPFKSFMAGAIRTLVGGGSFMQALGSGVTSVATNYVVTNVVPPNMQKWAASAVMAGSYIGDKLMEGHLEDKVKESTELNYTAYLQGHEPSAALRGQFDGNVEMARIADQRTQAGEVVHIGADVEKAKHRRMS